MKFNPISNDLFTDDDVFLKRLHCPKFKKWDDLKMNGSSDSRICQNCEKSVLKISDKSDQELVAILKNDPNTCLQINFNDKNLKVTIKKHGQ